MTTFEQIQELWGNQQSGKTTGADEIIRKAELDTKEIRRKHKGTILILSATVLILLLYFIYFSNGMVNRPLGGLMLMVLSMLARIAAEAISYRRLTTININQNLQEYTRQTALFYNFRKKILFIFTPLILILYAAGFLLLLPAVKENISHGFYIYIIISGICFAIFISWLIIKQTKKEVKLLQFLTRVHEDLKNE